jgi:hypothetical protein
VQGHAVPDLKGTVLRIPWAHNVRVFSSHPFRRSSPGAWRLVWFLADCSRILVKALGLGCRKPHTPASGLPWGIADANSEGWTLWLALLEAAPYWCWGVVQSQTYPA